MRLFLRVYAECPSADVASLLQEQFLAALARWTPAEHREPQQYWKIAQYFEFTFNLYPPTAQAHSAVRSLAGEGWRDTNSSNELSSVWNRPSGEAFLAPEVVWAELALNQ
jgi:hypothetical protein